MARKKTNKPALYLVVRVGWRRWYRGGYEWFRGDDGPCRSGRPIAAFAERAPAEARRAGLEAEARARLSPFNFLETHWLADYSSLPLEEFGKRLKKILLDVRLPRNWRQEKTDWAKWWDGVADRLSEEQREAVWALFDRLHFYAVVQTELEGA
jgi:hypothetical protein